MNRDPENNIIVKEVGFSLLAEGKTLRIKADGFSMYPTIKPGSIILIEPVTAGYFPSPGEIIAWKRQSGFVAHRLVRIIKKGTKVLYITRGDSCAYEDQPVTHDLIAGKVIQVETPAGTSLASGDNLIRKPFYLYNRLMVWVLVRVRKVLNPLPPNGGSKSISKLNEGKI